MKSRSDCIIIIIHEHACKLNIINIHYIQFLDETNIRWLKIVLILSNYNQNDLKYSD